MKLKHIALNIQQEEELVDFYEKILGFHFIRKYELSAEFANKLFGIDKKINVFIYSNFTIYLELFVFPQKINQGFAHICTEMEDRDIVADRCKKAGYPIIKIEREEKEDLLFIMDKAENKFELKNW
ncbi:MAG: VOC family protein [Bacteroidales bacterium]|nr:VOC family protein [Bacteroidales bacterium]